MLNVEALMVRRRGSILCHSAHQPSQPWLESKLLQRLRAVDPRRPFWVGDVDARVGGLQLPGSMADALGAAPAATLDAPIEERANRWIEGEPVWALPSDAVDAIASWEPPPDVRMVEHWKQLSLDGLIDLVTSVLSYYIDRFHAARTAQRAAKAGALAPLVTDSIKLERLADDRRWDPLNDESVSSSVTLALPPRLMGAVRFAASQCEVRSTALGRVQVYAAKGRRAAVRRTPEVRGQMTEMC